MPALIITGNPVDGFTFIGPFDDRVEAVEYADSAGPAEIDVDWWITSLTTPLER